MSVLRQIRHCPRWWCQCPSSWATENRFRRSVARVSTVMMALSVWPTILASHDFSGRYLTLAPRYSATTSTSISDGSVTPSSWSVLSAAEIRPITRHLLLWNPVPARPDPPEGHSDHHETSDKISCIAGDLPIQLAFGVNRSVRLVPPSALPQSVVGRWAGSRRQREFPFQARPASLWDRCQLVLAANQPHSPQARQRSAEGRRAVVNSWLARGSKPPLRFARSPRQVLLGLVRAHCEQRVRAQRR